MIGENLTYIISQELVSEVSRMVFILEALGGIVFFYVIFGLINLFLQRKKYKEIIEISKDLKDIKNILRKKKIR